MIENASPPAAGRSRLGAVVGLLVFCELASGFVQGYYSPLLPEIARWLQVNDADIPWFLTVQTLSAAVCVPLLSRLGDMFGHRRVLRIAMIVVALGVVVIAVVPSYPAVLAARVLQGPIAVWLPLEIAIIHGHLSGDRARRGVGMLVSFLTGGAIVGTITAGVVSAASPSLTLTLLVPLLPLTVSLWAVFFRIPESPERTPSRIDVPGFLGLAVAMVALLLGLSSAQSGGLASPTTWWILGFSVVMLAAWVWWERRTASPAIDIRLALSRRAGPIHLAGFLFGAVMFGAQAPLTTFLSADPDSTGYGFAASATTISLVVAGLALFATIGAALFAPIANLLGPRAALLTGAALPAAGSFFLAVCHTELWQVWVYAIVSGAGMGLLLGGLPAILAELTPKGQTGASVGVYNSLRPLGGAVGGAVFAAILGAWTAAGSTSAGLGGYQVIWVCSAVAFLIALIALLFLHLAGHTATPSRS